MDNRQEILNRFGRQAASFNDPKRAVASQELLRWSSSLVAWRPEFLALDVAAGTGLLARSVAPLVRRVVALDLTPAMLAEGRAAADRDHLANVVFLRGAAEDLPFLDGTFDVVMTRLSLHHIPSPAHVLWQMARVCRRGGMVQVIDLVAPDSDDLAKSLNYMERLRDPSHVRVLPREELAQLLGDSGLNIIRTETREVELHFEDWLELAATPPEPAQQIRTALESELSGGPPTGMRPHLRDALMFTHTWAALMAVRV